MVIVVTWTDGTSTTFSSCTNVTDDGKQLKFSGQRAGDGAAKEWVIMLTSVRCYSKETTGD